jgi:hypothetical protein
MQVVPEGDGEAKEEYRDGEHYAYMSCRVEQGKVHPYRHYRWVNDSSCERLINRMPNHFASYGKLPMVS